MKVSYAAEVVEIRTIVADGLHYVAVPALTMHGTATCMGCAFDIPANPECFVSNTPCRKSEGAPSDCIFVKLQSGLLPGFN